MSFVSDGHLHSEMIQNQTSRMTEMDTGRAPLAAAPTLQAIQEHDWRNEPPTRELIESLQRGEVVETRAFVRPIFKYVGTLPPKASLLTPVLC
jgi:hypothetical protein